MSLLLDALKEAEARKRALHESPPRPMPLLETEGSLALADDPPQPAAPESATAAATPTPNARAAAPQVVGAQPVAAHAPPSSKPLPWLIAGGAVLLLGLGAVAVYEAMQDATPVAVGPAAGIDGTGAPPRTALEHEAAGGEAMPDSWGASVEQPPRMPAPRPATVDAPGVAAQTARRAPSQTASRATAPLRRVTDAPTGAAASSGPPLRIERIADPLAAAFAAVQGGDLERARELYAQVLASEPGQLDAELGLAVIAHAQGADREAMRGYRRVLESVPDHPRAWAGLAELVGDADGPVLESRLRQLLAARPAAPLHFALGNLLARQQRWPDAQLEFFAAVSLAPQVADYVFNLAVALDRLDQTASAAAHYARALELAAQGGAARFDVAAAQARLALLREDRP